MPRLRGVSLETRSFLLPTAFEPGGVVAQHRFSGAEEQVAADVVIVVGERRPAALGVDLPRDARVQAIGDGVVPRRVSHAIPEGRAAAEAILAA
jgi:2,4-dienoyl-CoA reductase (NADPH2)